ILGSTNGIVGLVIMPDSSIKRLHVAPIGICRTERNKLEIFAPFGLDDIYAYQVRPTPHFLADPNRMELYRQRILKKQWKKRWLSLTVKEI
ncbi:nucleotidyltransferase family protein, partial [Streptococcus suis]|uniref:nucleotidyltransferase family protein n=1 Tax=Streptococcus suis TaxID=1307 RepID=UPI002AB47E08